MRTGRDESWYRQRAHYRTVLFVLSGLCFASAMVPHLFFSGATLLPISASCLVAMNVAILATGVHSYVKIGDEMILLGFVVLACIEAFLLVALLRPL
jgi:hypothetical protein